MCVCEEGVKKAPRPQIDEGGGGLITPLPLWRDARHSRELHPPPREVEMHRGDVRLLEERRTDAREAFFDEPKEDGAVSAFCQTDERCDSLGDEV